jgi:DNA-binding LytR/AlgR family response regulator
LDIAVVDDEKAIREYICGLVEERQPESRIEAYATGEELLTSGKRFDIVFLDIQMEGMNGIEAARSLREKNANLGVEDTVLVFITGIKDYVFDAFDLYAFQYLLKPIDERKFAEVLERAVREAAKKKERRVLFIKSRNLTLDQSEILYIESRAKKVEIHTTGAAQAIEIYAAMDELEGQLGENFYRCHRAYIVNMDCITEYDSESITLTGGDRVYLTKKKYGEFVKAYMWHLQNGGVSSV